MLKVIIVISFLLLIYTWQLKQHYDEEPVPPPGSELEARLEAQKEGVARHEREVQARYERYRREDEERDAFRKSAEYRYLTTIFQGTGILPARFDRMPEFTEAELGEHCPTVRRNIQVIRDAGDDGRVAGYGVGSPGARVNPLMPMPLSKESTANLLEASEWFAAKFCWRN